MTPEQFCYWLQGRAELMPDTPPSEAEWKMIREHLALTFNKVTPPLLQIGGLKQDPGCVAGRAIGVIDQFQARC